MKKKIIILATVATLAVGMTACGGTEQTNSNPTSTAAPTVEAETPVVTEEPTTETEETTVDVTETAGTEETTTAEELESTVDVTETAPSEETASEETASEEPTVEAELPSFGDKTLVITAMGESVDMLHEPVSEFLGYITYDAYAEDPATFDFEVLGIKGSQDISTKDALINAFIDYFGEPTYVENDFDDDDDSYYLYSATYVWEYAEGELGLAITAYGESRDVIDCIDITYMPE